MKIRLNEEQWKTIHDEYEKLPHFQGGGLILNSKRNQFERWYKKDEVED